MFMGANITARRGDVGDAPAACISSWLRRAMPGIIQ